jgi:hypothetical protein
MSTVCPMKNHQEIPISHRTSPRNMGITDILFRLADEK